MRWAKTLEQKLVLSTTCVFGFAAIWACAFIRPSLPEPVELDTEGHPYVGNPLSPVEITLFLDPKCPMCRRFHHEVLPSLIQLYRNTNQARFCFITLTFLNGGRPAGNALLEAHRQNSDLYYPLLQQVYDNQEHEDLDWATESRMIELSQTVPGLDVGEVRSAIRESRHGGQLDRNLEVALEVMDGEVYTPVLFINGRRCPSLSLEVIEDLTEHTLDSLGVR